jgi:HK97 family phage major capsid protein
MTEKTQAELIQEIADQVKSYNTELKAAQDLIKAKADQTKLDELFKVDADLTKTGILDKMSKNIIALSDQLDKIQLKMKDAVLKGTSEPWFVTLAKALKGEDFKKAAKKQGKFEVTFTTNPLSVLKVAGTMVTDDNLGGLDLDTAVVVPMREPGVFKAPDRPLTILDIIVKGTTTSNQITWVERTARTDGAARVAEAGIFVASDYHWALKKMPVEKIGTFVKVSNESLDDWEFTLSEINTELIGQLERELEEEVTSGNGTAHFDGILNRAVAYSYAGLNGKVVKCNLKDVVLAMKTQVKVANFQANYCVLNIAQVAEYESLKDANGQYLFQLMPGGGKSIAGLPVIEVSDAILASGYALVGDFTKDKLFMRREITIEMFDQDSTDAEYDLRMIRAKLRGANRIRVCDYNAFCYDAIADVQALIEQA